MSGSSQRRGSSGDPELTPNATLAAAIRKQRESCIEGMVSKRCQDVAALKRVHGSAATTWAVPFCRLPTDPVLLSPSFCHPISTHKAIC